MYNDEALRLNLDLLEEGRELALVRLAIYQRRTTRHYNRDVNLRRFEVRDLIFREAEAFTPQDTGKLMLNWEGPYVIFSISHVI